MTKTKRLFSAMLGLLMFAAAVFMMVPTAFSEDTNVDFEIKLVHTNDIHARVEENADSGIIGAAKLKTIADSFTANADLGLRIDSGDLFHGLPLATLSNGETIARIAKEYHLDIMTPGNHDWSYGKDKLKELANTAGAGILAGNVVNSDGTSFFDNEYLIKEITKGGVTLSVGLFGVIDPELYSSTAPANVEGLTFTDSAEFAKKAAAELKSKGCDIVIALSHTYTPAKLAAQVDDVDIWLCGHEHIDVSETVTTPNGGKAYVYEDGYYLYGIGLIDVKCSMSADGQVSDVKCERTMVDHKAAFEYSNDEGITKLLENIHTEQDEILKQPAGTSPAELDGVWEHLRIGETNLGKAVASAYILETGADVAFENAGGIRASVPKGAITYSDIIAVSPYGNYVVTKQVTGAQLKEITETVLQIEQECIAANDSGIYDAWPEKSGSYLQFAGMTVTYDPALENGKRIISIKVGAEALDENKLYTIATNNYNAGSSNFPALANAEETGEFSACDTALIRYFEQDASVIEKDISTVGLIKENSEKTDDPENTNPETGKETIVAFTAVLFIGAVTALLSRRKHAIRR